MHALVSYIFKELMKSDSRMFINLPFFPFMQVSFAAFQTRLEPPKSNIFLHIFASILSALFLV